MRSRTLIALGCYTAAMGAKLVRLPGVATALVKVGTLFDLAALQIQLRRAVERVDVAEIEAIKIELEERRRAHDPDRD